MWDKSCDYLFFRYVSQELHCVKNVPSTTFSYFALGSFSGLAKLCGLHHFTIFLIHLLLSTYLPAVSLGKDMSLLGKSIAITSSLIFLPTVSSFRSSFCCWELTHNSYACAILLPRTLPTESSPNSLVWHLRHSTIQPASIIHLCLCNFTRFELHQSTQSSHSLWLCVSSPLPGKPHQFVCPTIPVPQSTIHCTSSMIPSPLSPPGSKFILCCVSTALHTYY